MWVVGYCIENKWPLLLLKDRDYGHCVVHRELGTRSLSALYFSFESVQKELRNKRLCLCASIMRLPEEVLGALIASLFLSWLGFGLSLQLISRCLKGSKERQGRWKEEFHLVLNQLGPVESITVNRIGSGWQFPMDLCIPRRDALTT